ncbi:MAG TPA: DUF6151 family protein [Polyangiaceae bacterium]|nr:DUF6151 family protein [Polyangiaceae bacterium]
MAQDVELACRCGLVHGWVRGVSPRTVNRAICYCDDCQAFLHHLGRADLLDEHAGTDIVQVAPATVTYDRGAEHIVGVRLTPAGLYRWYASCCKTPLGNTRTPALPFVGLAPEVFRGIDGPGRDAVFGPGRGGVFGQYATNGAPEGSTRLPLGLVVHSVWHLLGWKLGGKAWPHPFFERGTASPSHPVTVLSREERQMLRAKCGPNPSASARVT